MNVETWTWIFVLITFSIYIYIALRSRAKDTESFYVAGHGVGAVPNGMAVAADWMSAASFISMAGLIAFLGYDGSVYLMGWTGGYVLLALLLAPYLRKFGKYTVPDFVGDRYYSTSARVVAIIAAIFVSFTYVAGQMRGVGIVFSRYLNVSITWGVVIGMAIVGIYAVTGGMKGITWTQVAQFLVLIVAFIIPAVAIANQLTDMPIPQLGFGQVLDDLDAVQTELGFGAYTEPFAATSKINVFCITLALMTGTAGLPHVIVRFYTTRTVRDARWSAGWALLFIALLYTTAPAVAAFAKFNLIDTVSGQPRAEMPEWFDSWEDTGLLEYDDKNGDGIIQYVADEDANELVVDRDIMVLANPEVAGLAAPVTALVAAGGLAAALSTASGLLLVIGSSIGHDLYSRVLNRGATEAERLLAGRIAVGVGILGAGYLGINPPGFVGEVVALAFGLAAASFFPVIVLGIFDKRTTKEGAIAGMLSGLGFTSVYIVMTLPRWGGVDPFIFGIGATGIGTVGMVVNLIVTYVVSRLSPAPPEEIQALVEDLRIPEVATPYVKGAAGQSGASGTTTA
jgi:cation/acetate symporter